MKTGICPKCREVKELTTHHLFPRRFYGTKQNKKVLLICRSCHNRLETFIPQKEKMPDKFYFEIVELFLAVKPEPKFW